MNVLSVRDLRKSYGTRSVFEGVSFTVADGEKVGFIGANGSGKSTLFRIVAGAEGVAGGEVAIQKGVRVGYLDQEPDFDPSDTILRAAAGGNPQIQKALVDYREISEKLAASPADADRLLSRQAAVSAVIEESGGWDWEHRVEAMLTRLGVEAWDRSMEKLSGGERKRVALARTLLAAPELLLLDEPTNHLDADTVLWLEEFLVDYRGAVMLITHDRYFLDRVVDRMIEVSVGELVPYAGGYTDYLEERAARDERAAVEESKRVRLIEQELEWARRAPPARTGKQKARIKRVKGLEEKQRRRASLRSTEVAAIETAESPRLGRTVVDMEGVSKAFGERVLMRDFSTMFRGGERIGVIGPNGAGKTTLLRLILGEEAPDSGEVRIGETTRIAYFDQARGDLDPEASIYEATADTDWVTVGERKMHLRAYLENFLFPSAIQQQKVRSLSGGERNRLLLARLFLKESNLLILDEPTNDLDLVTLRVLESAILEYPGCVLIVTHDRYVLDRVATALLAFEGNGVVRRHEGGYDRYRAYREEKEAVETAERRERERKEKERQAKAVPRPERSALTWKEKKELESLEAEIEAAERERDQATERLADPALYAGDPDEAVRLGIVFKEAEARVEVLYDRWAVLEERKGG